MGLLLDTTFLIDLERESLVAKSDGPAYSFLKHNADELLDISVITVGEFAAGFSKKSVEIFNAYISHFSVLPVDREVAWLFGQWSMKLRKKGNPIGANDLWIACTALRNERTVVTRNIAHFKRIDDLNVKSY